MKREIENEIKKLDVKILKKEKELNELNQKMGELQEQLQYYEVLELENNQLKNNLNLTPEREQEFLKLIQKLTEGQMISVEDFKKIAEGKN